MIKILAAVDENLGLGYKDRLLCHLPEDLKRFKKITENELVCMGSRTYSSIVSQLGSSLPNRTNIVFSRNPNFPVVNNDTDVVYTSVSELLHEYYELGESNLYVIGGGNIYSQMLPYCNEILLTKIHHSFVNVDTYLPSFNVKDFDVLSVENHFKDDKHEYDFTFLTLKRKLTSLSIRL